MRVSFLKKYSGIVLIILLAVSFNLVNAQSARSLINEGVDLYEKEKFSDAEVNFKKGLDKDYETFEGHFNLGDALYKQGQYDEALKAYQNAYALAETDEMKSRVFHNVGNSLLKGQKVKESIEAYKNALKLDPTDPETKYNLSYALNMMKNQQQNQQQQNQNQDQQNQDQNQQQQQQNQEQQNQQEQQQQQQQLPKDEISKEEAERILQALKNNEEDIQKEVRKKKGKPVKKVKDW